ncbi:restriction endonuclease subunit S [Shewanella baltica]|uniref:restriction endonuclease subunit S n=1 Tax=Shewanella baltica TaxID=62322 RepID=UPI00021130AF|nr:restriction endonuclease subunit S [Shewanella baltica]AEH16376.1 restriction modification system DNA specificity domain protein [Shewanella baltica OS117]
MSQLNYLEKLLDGVEVEWKALGEVCDFKNGFAFKSSLFKEAGLPIIRITNVDGKNISLDDVKYFDPSDYKENTASYEISKGDILIAMSGATTGKIGFYAHESPAYLNQRVGKFLPKPKILNNRYLYHYLLSKVEQIYVIAGGGAQPNLSSNALMAKIEIPIPCPNNPEKSLAIQAEIVRILDAFTAMTAELTAELNMRKKQYNYYRDQLLSFEDGEVEWKTLGDLAENLDSKRKPITSGLREAGEIPYYGASGIVDYVKDYIFDGDYLLVSEDGANLLARNTPIAFSISGKTWVNNHAHVLKFETYAERKYVEYYLNSIDLTPYISGAAQPKLNKKNLESINIPNPAPKEKERIVAILDKFDSLTCSIKEGLPREIELRQKQYEYYRDLLLSFKKSHSDEAA